MWPNIWREKYKSSNKMSKFFLLFDIQIDPTTRMCTALHSVTKLTDSAISETKRAIRDPHRTVELVRRPERQTGKKDKVKVPILPVW